jgi:hypothetical protein
LPPCSTGWGEPPLHATEERIAAMAEIGLTPLVERYWYRWTPADGLPERPGRLEFRTEPDDDVMLDVFRRVHEGTLDVHARKPIAESGVEVAAQGDLRLMHWMDSPRDWWLLGHTPDGDPSASSSPRTTTPTR